MPKKEKLSRKNEKSPRDFSPGEDVQVKVDGRWVSGKVIEPSPADRDERVTQVLVQIFLPKGTDIRKVKPRNVVSPEKMD